MPHSSTFITVTGSPLRSLFLSPLQQALPASRSKRMASRRSPWRRPGALPLLEVCKKAHVFWLPIKQTPLGCGNFLLFLSCLAVSKMASSIWLHQLLPALSFFGTSQSTTDLIFSWSIWITPLLIQWPRKSTFVWAPFRVQLLFLLHPEHCTQGSKPLPDGKTTIEGNSDSLLVSILRRLLPHWQRLLL